MLVCNSKPLYTWVLLSFLEAALFPVEAKASLKFFLHFFLTSILRGDLDSSPWLEDNLTMDIEYTWIL